MGDLLATGLNPGTKYAADSNGPYHEDREVTVAGGPGPQMFRVYNATYDTTQGQWKLPPMGSGLAYATVQNPDGSIHYLISPQGMSQWTNSQWLGNGNNAVYNAVDFGMSPNNTASGNTMALQNALTAAFTGGGGTVFIPSGTYHISGTIGLTFPPGNDHGVIIEGVGGDTEIVQIVFADVFSFQGLASGRGVRLRDLRITLAGQGTQPPTPPTAVRATNCNNLTCERVYFYNCQSALVADVNSLQCGLFDCTIDYAAGVDNQTMVTLAGAESFIDQCIIRQETGPKGCIGIAIGAISVVYVSNTHVSDFDTGIKLTGGTNNLVRGHFSNVECDSNVTAVSIFPVDKDSIINQLFFNNCIFKLTDGSASRTPGVIIDTNGGVNSHVSDIHFSNCMFHAWNGSGLQINAGQNITVDACRIGACALNPMLANAGGITITGTPANITIIGTDCTGSVSGDAGQQPYAISILSAVQGLYVRGCNLTGNLHGALNISGQGTQIEITDCAGYNDLNTPLNGGIAPTSSGTHAANCSTPYFGPSTVTFSNELVLIETHISLTKYDMSFGSIHLPRPLDEIWFKTAPPVFTWLGK